MTLTRKSLLEFFLTEKVQINASILFGISLLGIVILGVISLFTGIKISTEVQYIVGGPFIVTLFGFLFLGGPIMHLMAASGNYKGSEKIMRVIGNFFTFVASLGIVSFIERSLFSNEFISEIDTLPYLLKIGLHLVFVIVVATVYHESVKGVIKKFFQL